MDFRTATSRIDLPRIAREDARALVDRLLNRSSDEPFCAEQILAEQPELREFSSCVLDLAYEEFCRTREAGQFVAATEFALRFPDVQQSLYRVIEFDQILHQHPSLIDEIPEDRWPNAGEVFGEFQLLEQIGRGALSRVFLARQSCLGQRYVVAKVCVRGEREASLLGQLDHPGIAPVHSIHSDPETGLSTICMPWLTRATLHQLTECLGSTRRKKVPRERLSVRDLKTLVEGFNQPSAPAAVDASVAAGTDSAVRQDAFSGSVELNAASRSGHSLAAPADAEVFGVVVLRWAVQLADALAFAHTHNILHCDVKPGNVLLMPDLSVRLLDFNLAWSTDDSLRFAGGTLPYMASEQLEALYFSDTNSAQHRNFADIASQDSSLPSDGVSFAERPSAADARVTIQTDVFGLCATIWHVVSGEPPFGVSVDEASRADSAMVMQQRHRQGLDTSTIARIREILPQAAVDLLVSGLSADPAQRPGSAAEVACRLSALLPASSVRPPAHRLRLRKLAVTAGVSTLLALGILMVSVFQPGMLTGTTNSSRNAADQRQVSSGNLVMEVPAVSLDAQTLATVREHLRQRQFQASLQALARLETSTPEARFLELYSRSCLLSAPVFRPPEAFYRMVRRADEVPETSSELPWRNDDAVTLENQWLMLANEWQSLAELSDFGAECWANLAFIQLELNNLPAMESCFENACEAGLTPDQRRRLDVISQITRAQHFQRFTNADLLQTLKDNVLAQGTRGEALAWLTAAVRELRNQSGSSRQQQHQQTLAVSLIFEDPGLPVEADAIWLVLQDRRIFANKPLMKRILDASQTPRTTDRNRLVEVMLLPPESSAEVATLVASH